MSQENSKSLEGKEPMREKGKEATRGKEGYRYVTRGGKPRREVPAYSKRETILQRRACKGKKQRKAGCSYTLRDCRVRANMNFFEQIRKTEIFPSKVKDRRIKVKVIHPLAVNRRRSRSPRPFTRRHKMDKDLKKRIKPTSPH